MVQKFGFIFALLFCCILINYTKGTDYNQPHVTFEGFRDSIDTYIGLAEKQADSLPFVAAINAEKARRLSSIYNLQELEAYASYMLGKIKINLEAYYEAEKSLNASLNYYSHTNKMTITGQINYQLALVYYFLENYNKSIEYGLIAASVFRQINLEADLAKALESAATAYQANRQPVKAEELYKEALAIQVKLNNNMNEANLYQKLGILAGQNNNDSLAIIYYNKLIEIYKSRHDLDNLGITYCNIGLINLKQNDIEKAHRNFDRSLTYFLKTENKFGQMWVLSNLGITWSLQYNYTRAEDCYYKSLDIAKEINNTEGELTCYNYLSQFFEQRNMPSVALNYQKRYTVLKDSLDNAKYKSSIAELETIYSQVKKEYEEVSNELNIRQHQFYWYIIGGFFSLMTITVLVILNSVKQKRKAQHKLSVYKSNLESLVETRTKELQHQISIRKTAEESDQLKSAFLANMSHELRTPMNAIIAFSNFLREPNLNEDKKTEYLDHINIAGDSLLRIIDDIIDIAKIEAKQLKIFIQPTNISRTIVELHKAYKELLTDHKKKINFNISIDSNFCYIINTDSQRLKQILSNLIENAIKYTDRGEISIGFIPTETSVTFFVRDTGLGIPKDKLEHIFERFYQLNYLHDRKTSGTGLGLAISKNLTELLGGKIWVDSNEGKGSTFMVRIPVDSIKKVTTPISLDDSKTKALNQLNGYNWNNITILVAEDEDLNYKVLDTCLTRTKAHIIRAKDGVSAVEICKNQKVDVVLMDIQMPGMDGYEAAQAIKQLNNRTPIIAQTSFAMVGEQEKCLQAGCDDFISKPLNIESLLQKIQYYIR